MRMAGQWDGGDGLSAEVPSKPMGVNRKKEKLTQAQKWAIQRRGAWILREQGFTYTEIAVVMKTNFEAIHKLLYRTRRFAKEIVADAG